MGQYRENPFQVGEPTIANQLKKAEADLQAAADLLNAIIRSGLTIAQLEEPGEADPPFFLAIRAMKLS